MSDPLVLRPTYDTSLELAGDNGRVVLERGADLALKLTEALRGEPGAVDRAALADMLAFAAAQG